MATPADQRGPAQLRHDGEDALRVITRIVPIFWSV
jgi:hypothetical protein